VTALLDQEEPPSLGELVAQLEPQTDQALTAVGRELAAEVETYLREHTDGWSPEQRQLLATRLREQWQNRKRRQWQADPVRWSAEVAKVVLWSKQREILQAVRENTRVAVPSCHGAGKTFTAAVLASWWLSVHEPGTAFVVSTAPTFAQVRAVLWREINKLHRKADLPGHVNQTEWHLDGELVGFGRKPADTDESAFQGIHQDRVLVLLDEAGGIPEQLWVAAETVAVGDNDRIVAFGNPDDPTSHFEKICRPGSLWHVSRISAFDTPNLTEEPMPGGIPGGMVTRRWVEENRVQWGEDNPLWMSKVLGQFPAIDQFSTVRPGDVAACRIERTVPDYMLAPVELGVDVGGGGDMTSIRARHGIRAGKAWTARTPEPRQVVNLVIAAIAETPGVTSVKIDVGGIGWGIASMLEETLYASGQAHIRVVGVNFGGKASDPTKRKNVRAELWWDIGRGFSHDRAWDLSEVDDDTVAQLLGPRWSQDKVGRIVIEEKGEVIKRTGRSPDDADALLLAFYVGQVAEVSVTVPTGSIPTGAGTAARH
jgi:hypothetical protein